MAFVHAGGTIVERELAPGQTLRVDTGCIVALDNQVTYDVEMVGGVKSAIFGGEGFFFAKLSGPGKVWLQSLPFSRLAGRIWQAAPQTGGKAPRAKARCSARWAASAASSTGTKSSQTDRGCQPGGKRGRLKRKDAKNLRTGLRPQPWITEWVQEVLSQSARRTQRGTGRYSKQGHGKKNRARTPSPTRARPPSRPQQDLIAARSEASGGSGFLFADNGGLPRHLGNRGQQTT